MIFFAFLFCIPEGSDADAGMDREGLLLAQQLAGK
jgi:hypothetical protein